MTRKIAFEYNDFKEFEQFARGWSTNLSRVEQQNALGSDEVVQAVARFVADEIRERTIGSDRFANFMADRTYVEASRTSHGITFDVGGYSEQEMNEKFGEGSGRLSEYALEDMIDYNLWDMYEHHGNAIGGGQGSPRINKSKKIVKDVGGVVAYRNSSGETVNLKGRSGLISGILDQIKPQLLIRIGEVLQSSVGVNVMQAAASAAKKAKGIKGLEPGLRADVQRQARKLDIDMAKLGGLAVSSGGTLRERGAGGRFVSSGVSKIRVNVKK